MEGFSKYPEATHYDTVHKRAVKIFDDTLDYAKNTVRAEIMSGKDKGLFTIVNLDNLTDLNNTKMVAEGGDVPAGAEFDSQAPWNQDSSVEIKNYMMDDEDQQFKITLSNNEFVEVDYIDVIEDYWKSNPGSFEKDLAEFGELDDRMDQSVIEKLKNEGHDFESSLESILRQRGLI